MRPGSHQPFGHREPLLKSNTVLTRLIGVNVLIFILIHLFSLLLWLFKIPAGENSTGISHLAYWLSVPADVTTLQHRPWGIFTYMFVHTEFLHLLFNMVTLYFGGKLFLFMLNERKLIATYVMGGLSGAVFFIASYHIFPVFEESVSMALAIGASASVLAILMAAAAYAPNFKVALFFVGSIPLKYIALLLILIDVLSISHSNPGGHIAHLGGAAWGFIYIRFFGGHATSFKKPFPGIFTRKKIRKSYVNKRVISDEDFLAMKNKKQAEIDAILDKIAKTGYDGLSKDEKDILFKAGRK